MLLLCTGTLLLDILADLMNILLQLVHLIMYTFFQLQLKFLFIMNVIFEFLKVPSIFISQTPQILLLHLETPSVVCSSNLDELCVCFKYFSCLIEWFLLCRVCFLIPSLFLSCSRFFVISMNNFGLVLLYVKTYVKVFQCYVLCGSQFF